MVKVFMILVVALLASIVGAKIWYGASTAPDPGPVNEPWVYDEMKFVSWNGSRWTAWVREGAFEQLPEDEGKWHRHARASIAFVDWEGRPWQAKIDGDTFLLAARGNWKGPIEQATEIRYRDWEGNNQVRTVAQLRR